MASTFTCISCRVAFRDLEVQRQHYKSDWHRYNLKKKAANLPPATVEQFQQKVIAKSSIADEKNQIYNLICKPCQKNFHTQNQYDNHLLSKKHQASLKNSNSITDSNEDQIMVDDKPVCKILKKPKNNYENLDLRSMEIDSDVESVDEWDSDTENPVENNDCLFCNHHSRTWMSNLKHMTKAHSFFLPDAEYCIDIQGLLIYLGKKVFSGYMCLWCNNQGKEFRSSDAARTHMLDKGHCKMLHEGETLAEYAEFYDYFMSYPDHEIADPNAEVDIPELEENDCMLTLPSGTTIGHRSLVRYWKQNLGQAHNLEKSNRSKNLNKVLTMYRSLGYTGTQKEAIKKKAIDLKYMHKLEQKYYAKLGCKANKLQHHFRQQNNF